MLYKKSHYGAKCSKKNGFYIEIWEKKTPRWAPLPAIPRNDPTNKWLTWAYFTPNKVELFHPIY